MEKNLKQTICLLPTIVSSVSICFFHCYLPTMVVPIFPVFFGPLPAGKLSTLVKVGRPLFLVMGLRFLSNKRFATSWNPGWQQAASPPLDLSGSRGSLSYSFLFFSVLLRLHNRRILSRHPSGCFFGNWVTVHVSDLYTKMGSIVATKSITVNRRVNLQTWLIYVL